MDNSTIGKEKDPMGRAISDYYRTGKAAKLRVFSSMFYEDEIPVATLFRGFEDMPLQEQKAVELCRGRVLGVGGEYSRGVSACLCIRTAENRK